MLGVSMDQFSVDVKISIGVFQPRPVNRSINRLMHEVLKNLLS